MYGEGKGVRQDYTKAREWYQKAADQGDAYAQNNIGAMYYLGHGERQDYAKAAEWFEKACDNGNKKSCYFSFKSKIGY